MIVSVTLILTCCRQQRSVIVLHADRMGGLYEISENGMEFKYYNSDQVFKLDTLTYISLVKFDKIYREESPFRGVYSLGFELNETGKREFEEMTARNINKQVCFVLNGKVMAAPYVQTTIPNGRGSVTVTDEKAIDEMIKYLNN